MASTAPHTVLVVGGAGFVGYHLVSHFIAHATFAEVFVLSRSASSSKNRVEGAAYLSSDITNLASIERILDHVKPDVIIHAASPSPVTGTAKEYHAVNIVGTQNLLKYAKQSNYVRAFIYTSSSTLAKGAVHIDTDETCALANTDPKAPAYARSKADAEIMVLHANYPKTADEKTWAGHLATAALRFPIIYGTRDTTSIPGCLNALAKGQTTTTLGDGINLWSFCSASNCAVSHALLASALLETSPRPAAKRVDGEAFNINDGTPYAFWGFARLCWKRAGGDPSLVSEMTHLPSWFALALATVLEWVYWIFTLGMKRPYTLGRQQVEYACFEHTYSIEKVRQRLGFEPKVDFEVELKKAVEWCLEEGGWRAQLKGVKGVKVD
ncbi:NAD(P)-binding protein [Trematosphaeria pertusa]|uniref:NAD(P)-binding protein n=1 Tax=Trematosphaeria pertusa TaxID=390896 RepID=A0A6A6IL82_9PLEO|nr:NAD(P)-binding protein [Trematosphaeria pertusa]KAF2250969.1 NAD(P)-binding protein [Trematosphaeria pertusa]